MEQLKNEIESLNQKHKLENERNKQQLKNYEKEIKKF